MQVALFTWIGLRLFICESFRFSHLYFASVLAGGRQHFSARTTSPHKRRSRRDFKNHAFLMAEERWSVAGAGSIQRLSEKLASLKIK
jgi:hypothetical protein